jgi:hypothetical protein
MLRARNSTTLYSLDFQLPVLGVGVAAQKAAAPAITAATKPNQGLSLMKLSIMSIKIFIYIGIIYNFK